MKRIISAILFAALILSSLVLVSCGGKDSTPNFVTEGDKIVSEDGTKKYVIAPMGFQPSGVGDLVAMRDGAFELHQIVDQQGNLIDTDEWLTSEYGGSLSTVYYRDDIALPAYDRMNYDACYLCVEDVNILSFAKIDDSDTIRTLIALIANGKTVDYFEDDATDRYTMKFSSPDFPAIMYSVDILVFEGRTVVFNRATGLYADAGELIAEYLPDKNG